MDTELDILCRFTSQLSRNGNSYGYYLQNGVIVVYKNNSQNNYANIEHAKVGHPNLKIIDTNTMKLMVNENFSTHHETQEKSNKKINNTDIIGLLCGQEFTELIVPEEGDTVRLCGFNKKENVIIPLSFIKKLI